MIEVGQKRIMRDGTPVTVTEIFQAYDEYWKRERPFVRLDHPDGEIVRARGTVESYLLEDLVKGGRNG